MNWRPLFFFALPAALPVLAIGVLVALGSSPAAAPGWWGQVVFAPLVALVGVAGALFGRRALLLGSAVGLAFAALLALGQPALLVWYGAPAALMALTAPRL